MRSGINPHSFDQNVRIQDDLFAHVNNNWLAQNPIPEDKSRYGSFNALTDKAETQMREIVAEAAETAVQAGSEAASRPAVQVGNLYRSFMDEEKLEEIGLRPLNEPLTAISETSSVAEFMQVLGGLQKRGLAGLFGWYVDADARNTEQYRPYLMQGGLGLPDESYYHQDSHAEIRAAYLAHMERLLALAVPEQDTATWPQTVMAVETVLAEHHWDVVASRDGVKTYNKMLFADLVEAHPQAGFARWREVMESSGAAFTEVIVRQPEYFHALGEILTQAGRKIVADSAPAAASDGMDIAATAETISDSADITARITLEDLKTWATWQVVSGMAPYLPAPLVAERFDFAGRTLTGTPEIRPRWKRALSLVEGALGEAAGELYVEKHFQAEAKDRMEILVADVVEAYRQCFADLPWMGPETRERALAKLASFRAKIGYPEKWRNYQGLRVDAADLVGNVQRSNVFDSDYELAKIGQPIDRSRWLMTPQTVNAYYHPTMNEIVFPAAILQPPFFDPEADDAVNYGGIGAVIGHEIGHGFDDQGSRYDAKGELVDWWTPEDRERFEAATNSLIAQFNALETRDAPGEPINGAFTIGENIGDLGGLGIGLAAYRLACTRREDFSRYPDGPVLDGFTGVQRFFLGWAHVWAGHARPEEAKRLLAVDPHAPMDQRANTVRNIPAFIAAFAVEPGDGMWLDPADQVQVFA